MKKVLIILGALVGVAVISVVIFFAGRGSRSDTSVASCEKISSGTLTIEYRNGEYFEGDSETPQTVFCVTKGTAVTFVGSGLWVASDPHPIHTSLRGFDAKGVRDSYTFTFDEAETVGFHNHERSGETGEIVVQ